MFCFIFLTFFAYSLADNSSIHVSSIIILAGQSNMSGRGGVIKDTWDGVVPLECSPNPSILRLNAELKWVEAQEPLHKDIDVNETCGVGPGMSFANSILKKKADLGVIGLVPCAVGGTKITEWEKGTFLYDQMMSRTKAALKSGGFLIALLWYQGESDTKTIEDATLYLKRLERFFVSVREDLQSPLLPIVQAVLASGRNYTEIVRKAQMEIELQNIKSVDAMGLELEPDNIHLTTESQVELGEKLAISILETAPLSVLTVQTSGGASRYTHDSICRLLFIAIFFRSFVKVQNRSISGNSY